ncbi:hypothetical protein DPMN_022672 [Dreissena polymorpha]|uniref:Methyltransferase HEMK2 n=1 Tax=Dreissena polymorpha TaxID=45954 RepID=A0A9D4SBY8_DREPO|nr:hypothetical protein DPMN_022672 [Dreissena polymorpha]
MTTPDISHITGDDYAFIYEPAEDSFLLLDAIDSELKFLHELRPIVTLEVGSGSGICSAFLAKELKFPVLSLCTDINPRASLVTKATGDKNGVNLQPVTTDLVSGLLPRLNGQVDVLVFNPPYVVTPSDEVSNGGIEASWAGGTNGREVIDRLLPFVPQLLSDSGVFYMVVIKENKPKDIQDILSKSGFHMTVVINRRSGPEFLSVLKFSRT